MINDSVILPYILVETDMKDREGKEELKVVLVRAWAGFSTTMLAAGTIAGKNLAFGDSVMDVADKYLENPTEIVLGVNMMKKSPVKQRSLQDGGRMGAAEHAQ